MRRPFVIPEDLPGRLLPTDAPPEQVADLRHAAVLALILPGESRGPTQTPGLTPSDAVGDGDDPRLLLIERSGTLRSHAGQIAFPGGKPEPHDSSLVATALREAEEEVGLERGAATLVGRLPGVPTPTGFMIVPFVAWAAREWTPRRTSPEVHRILTPSFSLLADPTIHRITGRGVWNGYAYELHEFDIHKPPLWGATARMVWDLLQRLAD